MRSAPSPAHVVRGKTADEDAALEKELLADQKERAEHVMLVDLARNDIGRVCDFGSVQVRDLMIIERYSHVMHIVSSVEGKLSAGKTPYDLMRATFPAGTVSGARRFAPCRSSLHSKARRAGRMPVAWATSASTAIWTRASPSAPRWKTMVGSSRCDDRTSQRDVPTSDRVTTPNPKRNFRKR